VIILFIVILIGNKKKSQCARSGPQGGYRNHRTPEGPNNIFFVMEYEMKLLP
jgi:hypothetical protein